VARDAALATVARVARALPAATPAIERYRVLTAALPSTDPLRYDRRPAAVADTARALVAALVAALPLVGDEATAARRGAPPTIARRLWPRLTPTPATPARVALLDAALVLLADHDLAASTLAARVAASTWADPYAVVGAGLAALSGPLHGAASEEVRRVLRPLRDGVAGSDGVAAELRAHAFVPGFGHRVYTGEDPRCGLLLAALPASRPDKGAMAAVDELQRTMAARGGPTPNVDLAVAAMAEGHAMVPGAGEVVFATARIVGWVAHAIEEYRHALRFRPRARYVGPPPS
jgi:citrate synthase